MFAYLRDVIAATPPEDIISARNELHGTSSTFEEELAATEMVDLAKRSLSSRPAPPNPLAAIRSARHASVPGLLAKASRMPLDTRIVYSVSSDGVEDLEFLKRRDFDSILPNYVQSSPRANDSSPSVLDVSLASDNSHPGCPLLLTPFDRLLDFAAWVPDKTASPDRSGSNASHKNFARILSGILDNILVFGEKVSTSDESKNRICQSIASAAMSLGSVPGNVDELCQSSAKRAAAPVLDGKETKHRIHIYNSRISTFEDMSREFASELTDKLKGGNR